MSNIIDIRIIDLAISLVMIAIPVMVFAYYKIKLIKGLLISVLRMIVQLSLVAIYLEWVFDKNSAIVNSLWVVLMIVVGVFTAIKRVSLNWKIFVLPLSLASLTSVLILDSFFLGFIIKLEYVFDARYFIPITGMILGNSLNHNIVGLSAYFTGLKEKEGLYQFVLTNTGKPQLALRPFISEAIKKALNPMIATMSVIGLISLPGMMTGQILGGSSPAVAIKYQIMIMIAIFVGCTLNLVLSIVLTNKFIFDGFGNLKESVFCD